MGVATALLLAVVLGAPTGPELPEPLADEEFIQWTQRPGPATAEEQALVERSRKALESGTADVSAVLVDPAYASIHPRTEFRELIALHAKAAPLSIAGPGEPGTRLVVELEFKDQAGRPVPDALVYAYHTSAKGWYSDKGAHIQAVAGDVKHARLFGYARTDARGRVELRTIRPAGYPNSELPAHIHLGLTVRGRGIGVGEVRFDDDPRMTPLVRRQSAEYGDVVVTVERGPDGAERCHAVFQVELPGGPG